MSHNQRLRIMHIGGSRSARAGLLGKRPRVQHITAEQFRDARVFAGFTRPQAAEFLGVSLRSVGHWETGKARCPYAAFKLLRIYRHGDLIDPRWSGFRLSRGGHLVTPEGHELAPSDMTWLSLTVRRGYAMSELLAERDGRRRRPSEGTRPQGVPSTEATAVHPGSRHHPSGDVIPADERAGSGASGGLLLYGLVSYSTSDPGGAKTAKNTGIPEQGAGSLWATRQPIQFGVNQQVAGGVR